MITSSILSTNTFSVEFVVLGLSAAIYLVSVVCKLLCQLEDLLGAHSKGSGCNFFRYK